MHMLKVAKNANLAGMMVCIISGLTYVADYFVLNADKLIGLIGVQFLATAYMFYGNMKLMEKLMEDIKGM